MVYQSVQDRATDSLRVARTVFTTTVCSVKKKKSIDISIYKVQKVKKLVMQNGPFKNYILYY